MTVDSSQINTFLPHMNDVNQCKNSLNELNLMWRFLESSAKINSSADASSLLNNMSQMREKFHSLEKELVLSLGNEEISTILNKMGTKAQYVIDILVRNLYERTADVGFLATDEDICRFVANPSQNEEVISARLKAYRNKYTVYDEIILLDIDGNVLVNIDEASDITASNDPLIKKTLATDDYVETYQTTDLRPKQNKTLIYSKRITDVTTGDVIGVLCLCFNLAEEMRSIFQSHGDTSGRSILLLLDASNHVIATSDPAWINVETTMPEINETQSNISFYRGREYLVRKLSSEGYQAYQGPKGWKGQVMTPIDVAFSGKETGILSALDSDLTNGLISYAQSLCPAVSKVNAVTASIQTLVWNGQVMTTGEKESLIRLKYILDQISETGIRGNEILTNSINDLYETIISANQKNIEVTSHLLVDLLDRNLYERANDCRWWALSSALKEALSSTIDIKTTSKLTNILEYINQLYTVYTRIFIYDSKGKIIASTNATNADGTIIGKSINHESLSKVMQLKTEQDYYVSPFTPDPLYENKPTYIYHAAIRSPQANKVVGGIGVVFDSTVEFSGMLKESIPTNDAFKAFYINREGIIISSTDPAHAVGSTLAVSTDLLKLPNGESTSQVVIHDNHYALLGCSASNGYREFKVSDGYQEDVIAVVYHLLGEVRDHVNNGNDEAAIITSTTTDSNSPEFATFFIANYLFAIEAFSIVQALPANNISSVTLGDSTERVGMIRVPEDDEKDTYAWVYDLAFLVSGQALTVDDNSQVIVVECNKQKVGFLVSALHSVAKFNENEVSAAPLTKEAKKPLIKELIQVHDSKHLIQVIDLDCLIQLLEDPFAPIEINNRNNNLVSA